MTRKFSIHLTQLNLFQRNLRFRIETTAIIFPYYILKPKSLTKKQKKFRVQSLLVSLSQFKKIAYLRSHITLAHRTLF